MSRSLYLVLLVSQKDFLEVPMASDYCCTLFSRV